MRSATLHPSKPMYTFWDYKRNRWPRDAGLRLDHLLLSPALAPRLIKAGVDRKLARRRRRQRPRPGLGGVALTAVSTRKKYLRVPAARRARVAA